LDRVYDRVLDRVFDRGLDRVFDRGLDRVFDRGLDRVFDRGLDRVFDRVGAPEIWVGVEALLATTAFLVAFMLLISDFF
jgi:hypothetical protein